MLNDVMKHSNAAVDTLLSGNSKISVNINEEIFQAIQLYFH